MAGHKDTKDVPTDEVCEIFRRLLIKAQDCTHKCVHAHTCAYEGCTKHTRAQGNTSYCIGHGGDRRCEQEGCTKSAQGKTSRCKGHGGGKGCQQEGCIKSAQYLLLHRTWRGQGVPAGGLHQVSARQHLLLRGSLGWQAV
jgi:hypothetical protein